MRSQLLLPVLCFLLLSGCQSTSAQQKPNPHYSRTDRKPLKVSDAEWKKILPSEVYYIARKAGTDRAFSSPFHDNHEGGTYFCAACGNPLYASSAKFESGTGWPSFYQAIRPGSVTRRKDPDGYREELRCGRCEAHLGHVFDDGPKPTGLRHCINGTVLHFAASK